MGRTRGFLPLAGLFAFVLLGMGSALGDPGTPYVPDQVLVKFQPGTPASVVARAHASIHAAIRDEIPQIGVQIVGLPRGLSVGRAIGFYERNPNVEFAEPDYYVERALSPNDPYWVYDWQATLRWLSAAQAWDITVGDPSVVIAVLDSGIDYTHPDLQGERFLLGPDFANNDNDPWDDYGHGTITTGVVGASTNNGVGIAGTTWDNGILVIKDGGATAISSATANGIIYAADYPARVALIESAGGYSSTVESAVNYAHSHGMVMVAPTGNYVDPPQYPAAYPEVIAVSGIDGWDQWATGYGPYVAVCAYASGVYTTVAPFGTSVYYGTVGGTSVAAPFVAGAAALVLSVNPALTPDQVRDIICQSADDLGDAGWDQYYGWGRVNLYRAVLAAVDSLGFQDDTPPTVEIVAPQDAAIVSGVTEVAAAAADNVGVSVVDFYVNGALLGSDAAAPYSLPWDTTGAPSGSHALQAVAYDQVGNWSASGPVSVVVDNATTVTETFLGKAGGRDGAPAFPFTVRSQGTVTAALSWGGRRADLDLYLWDATGGLVGQSATAARPEIIALTLSPATYWLQVAAASGKTTFSLEVTHP